MRAYGFEYSCLCGGKVYACYYENNELYLYELDHRMRTQCNIAAVTLRALGNQALQALMPTIREALEEDEG